MIGKIWICVACGLLFGFVGFANGQQLEEHQALAKFQKDLAKRVTKDQACRYALIKFNARVAKRGSNSKDEKQHFRLAKRASDIDDKNLKWLKEQIAAYGLPTPSQIGRSSAEQFFLLILHADRDREFQKDCVRRMKESPEWAHNWKPLERRASQRSSRESHKAEDPKSKDRSETEESKELALPRSSSNNEHDQFPIFDGTSVKKSGPKPIFAAEP